MTNSIAIVGGGISGTLVVLNLIKTATEPVQVFWFDATNSFCKGLAYSTYNNNHLLNVRASNMSVFKDEPSHFVNWLTSTNKEYSKDDFVPRKIYAEYVAQTLEDLENENEFISLQKITSEVTAILKTEQAFIINSIETVEVKKVVLALGNFLPSHPAKTELSYTNSKFYLRNAFSNSLEKTIENTHHLTIVGSGLTMLDTLISLHLFNYQGKITIISPHGITPLAQKNNPEPAVHPFVKAHYPYRLIELFSEIKKQLKFAEQHHLNSHSVIDQLRPHLQFIWTHFSLEDKQQFLRHLRHKWGVVRHRAPAKTLEMIDLYQSQNKLQIIKGRIKAITVLENATSNFTILHTSKNGLAFFETDVIINCTGPEANLQQCDSVLIKQLLQNNIIQVDELKYGVNADLKGKINTNLYTLGPLLKGILWESTAVPEIRIQAYHLAQELIKS